MKKIIYGIIIVIITLFIYLMLTNQKYEYQKNIFAMDTYINIKIYNKNKNINNIIKEVENIYDKYDKLADAYQEYENIINIHYLNNILPLNTSIEISEELRNLITYGLNVYDETDGLVNIALGNVTNIWKIYQSEGTNVPSITELNEQNINIKDIVIDENKFLKKSDIKLDFGAIAKGYVTEIVGDYLEENNIDKYLINAGGNVKVGNHYENQKYIIGIENPENTNQIYKKIKVTNKSIVTSGDYQRYYEVDGVRYNHIINPKTLFPSNYYKSVTVITENSSYADLLSTYLFLLPIEEALKYVNENDSVEAIFYVDKDNIITSKGFLNYE